MPAVPVIIGDRGADVRGRAARDAPQRSAREQVRENAERPAATAVIGLGVFVLVERLTRH